MGNWNQDSSGLSDEDMDQSLQQDIAAANFAASGGDLGNYTFGGNFVNDVDSPDYTGTSTNINQAVADMQSLFNTQRGITASNPYGKEGFYSRVLGIDPSKIDYSSNMDLNTRMSIASNQFSKYMNPQNVKGQIGFNPAYDPAEKGKLRAGVQDENYQTVYGPVMEQSRKQGTGEMLARGAMGLFGGPVGMALAQLGTKEYGLPGVDGFDSFDPNNPRPGGGILGQFLGGLNPTQAKDALVGAFAPSVPAPTPTSIGTAPADLKGFENRFSQHPLTGETTVKTPESLSTVDTFSLGPLQGPPQLIDQSISPLNMDIGLDYPGTEFDRRIRGSFTETGGTMDDAREKALQAAFRPREEQLAGLDTFGGYLGRNSVELSPNVQDFLDEHGMSVRDLMDKDFSKVPDGARLPSGQIMGPEFRPNQISPAPEPNIMQLIEDATRTTALGGSSTANQLAQVDFSNLNNVGGNLYQPVPETSAFDSFLEKFGMKELKRRSSGQIYSPNKSRSFFDNPVGYLLGS
jgi:hypothetical protein